MNVKERRAPVLKVEDLTVSFTRYDRGMGPNMSLKSYIRLMWMSVPEKYWL